MSAEPPADGRTYPAGHAIANEMHSPAKNTFDHEKPRRDIIEGYKSGSLIQPSIMSPLSQRTGLFMLEAVGVPSGPERQRTVPGGATTAPGMDKMMADRETLRDRKVLLADDKDFVGNVALVENDGGRGLALMDRARLAAGQLTPLLDSPLHQYARKVELMLVHLNKLDGTETERWQQVLAPYAPASRSFYLMRAAGAWHCRRTISALLRSGPNDATSRLPNTTTMAEIERNLASLDAIQGITRMGLLQTSGRKARLPSSKKDELSQLAPNWKAVIAHRAQRSRTYADAVAVLALVGCRPDELLSGVRVRLDGRRCILRIEGSKFGEFAGQTWREIEVLSVDVPDSLLDPLLDGRDETYVSIRSTAALRQALKEMSHDLWPTLPHIVPYHFRHSVAEDLRDNGWAEHEVASVLGERSAATARHYGRKRRPKRTSPPRTPVLRDGVRTAIAVKPLVPFDPSSLRKKVAKGSKTRL